MLIELIQNMMRAARAPAPMSGAAVAIAPTPWELELDAVAPDAAEEAWLAPDEIALLKGEEVEDVPFPAEELEPVSLLELLEPGAGVE